MHVPLHIYMVPACTMLQPVDTVAISTIFTLQALLS